MPDPATEEILWYRPDPRAILPLDRFHCSRSLGKIIRHQLFSVTFNSAFPEVISHCANRPETWINDEFIKSYHKLFKMGYAHSLEIWHSQKLAGGIYGVHVGGAFFAESMFSLETNASKVGLFYLTEHLKQQSFSLLEVQFLTPHLRSLGAIEIPGDLYEAWLQKAIRLPCQF